MLTTTRTAAMRLIPPTWPPFISANAYERDPLHHAIDLLRTANQAQRLKPEVQRVAREMVDHGLLSRFLRQHATVACAVGRGAGHTGYILQNAKAGDLVLIGMDEHLMHCRAMEAEVVQLTPIMNMAELHSRKAYRNVYVDDASRTLTQHMRDMLYGTLGRTTDQTFILLG